MLYASFEKIASQVLRNPPKGRDLIPAVVDWLESTKEEWLLVIDNYNNGDLSKVIPGPGRGNILFTSTRTDLLPRPPPHNGRLIVPEMDLEESTTLLLRAAERDEDNEDLRNRAKPLVEELGFLPLALDHAGAQIRERGYSLELFVASLRKNKQKFLRDPKYKEKSQQALTIHATLDLSLRRLRAYAAGSPEDPEKATAYKSALEILNAFCFYHHEAIDLKFIVRACGNMSFAERWGDIWEPLDVADHESVQSNESPGRESTESREAIENIVLGLCPRTRSVDVEYIFDGIVLLTRFNFLKQIARDDAVYRIHPLVHAWLRDRMDPKTYKSNFRLARRILYHGFHPLMHDVHSDRHYISMLPHIRANSSFFPQDDSSMDSPLEEAEITCKHARILAHSHLWEEAIPHFEKAVRELSFEIDPSSATTLGTMMDLGAAYIGVNRIGDAAKIYHEVMDRGRCCNDDTKTGMAHVVNALSELSMLFLLEGIFHAKDMARDVVNEALRWKVRSLRPWDRLCLMLQYTGDWQEAEELADLVVRVRKEQTKHGPEHHETLRAVVQLARIRARRGKTDQAKQDLVNVVSKFEKDLGPHHLDTVIAKSELAWVYHLQGGERLEEAEKIQRASLEEGRVTLGCKHPYTHLMAFRLGLTIGERGRYGEAAILLRASYEDRKAWFGPKHPVILGAGASWISMLEKKNGPGYLKRQGYSESEIKEISNPDELRWAEFPWMYVEGTSSTLRIPVWNRFAKECIKKKVNT